MPRQQVPMRVMLSAAFRAVGSWDDAGVIWKLGHPLRGLIAALAVAAFLGAFIGFGAGLPELLFVATVAIATALVVGRPNSTDRTSG